MIFPPRDLPRDPSGYLVVIDSAHHKRHEGEMFEYAMEVTLTAGAVHDMIISVGASTEKRVHFDGWVSSDEKVKISFWKSSTWSGGTDITSSIWSSDELSGNSPSQLTLIDSPTVTATGTFRDGAYADKWVLTRSQSEKILTPSTDYLFRIEYDKADANSFMGIMFYEQD